jgi:hypothetical protein
MYIVTETGGLLCITARACAVAGGGGPAPLCTSITTIIFVRIIKFANEGPGGGWGSVVTFFLILGCCTV